MTTRIINLILKSSVVLSVLVLSACASIQQTDRVAKVDPFERVNRAVFSFNEAADEYVIKPAAEAYKFVLPEFVRTGVTNFFSNINDVFVAANNLLQGKPSNAVRDRKSVV